MVYRSTLRGTGLYVPERVMTNDEIATRVDTSDAWIVERTGIRRRRIAADSESTASMATIAGKRALENAGIASSEIDLTIVATSTPDYGFPASACLVQHALGTGGGACDMEAACSGFVYALSMACGLIGSGLYSECPGDRQRGIFTIARLVRSEDLHSLWRRRGRGSGFAFRIARQIAIFHPGSRRFRRTDARIACKPVSATTSC